MSDSSNQCSVKPFAVLLENEFDACHVRSLQDLFCVSGIEVTFLSYLWGHESLTFASDDPAYSVQVSRDVTQADPNDFSGILLPGGYAMDRLRFQLNPICGQLNQAPAVVFLRAAVAAMNEGKLKIGAVGHGLMLFTAAPEILHGRQVTCSHNIMNDVANAGGIVMFNGNQTADLHLDRGLLTARDGTVTAAFLAALISLIKGGG